MTDVLEIKPYDPRWAADFEQERARLVEALGMLAVRIEHNGSTSVPGLSAKPVIDIQISVRPLHPIDLYASGTWLRSRSRSGRRLRTVFPSP
jgi:GrpB-like predicted nucleotidyltransferase (UPF0157 family)